MIRTEPVYCQECGQPCRAVAIFVDESNYSHGVESSCCGAEIGEDPPKPDPLVCTVCKRRCEQGEIEDGLCDVCNPDESADTAVIVPAVKKEE